MATAPKSLTALDNRQPEMPERTERRDHLLLGDLPDDFLRIIPTVENQQIASDEQTALALQQQFVRPPTFSVVPGAALPSNTRGRLDITVVEAKLTKNYGVTRMDPYVRIRVGHHIYETKTSYNGAKNPKWGKVFHCFLPNGVDVFHTEIYDERAFSNDEKIAWAMVNIPQRVLDGETVEDWIPLNGKQGDGREGTIGIVMSFTGMPNISQGMPMQYPMPVQGIPMGSSYSAIGPVHVQNSPPPNPPIAHAIVISEEDVIQLKEMFPSLDTEVIQTVLESERGNKDRAVNSLLQMTT
ncbi:Toll-interacting protein [Halotydeus destructor]|nr:Toll-interacting protein [Halotydeus destructor]